MHRLRGLKDLLFDAVDETTHLVERTHQRIVDKNERLLAPVGRDTVRLVAAANRGTAAGVYATIRVINHGLRRLADAGLDVAFEVAAVEGNDDDARRGAPAARAAERTETLPLRTPQRADAAGTPAWLVDSAQGALNGFIGDHLRGRGNALEIEMTLRQDGQPIGLNPESLGRVFADATGRLCIFVHGLSCTEWAWSLYADRYWGDPAVTFGTKLRNDLGFTPLYLRYNTGLHVSENGRQLAKLIDDVVRYYPRPVREIVLVGHSMGGLVVRSAVHYATTQNRAWAPLLRHVFCISSPHLGAPLEKLTNAFSSLLRKIDTAGTQVPAAILDSRSAGIKDLRFGYTVDEEWFGQDPDAFLQDNRQHLEWVDGVGYYFLASTVTSDPAHPLAHLLGDVMVRLPSAAGHHPEPARRLRFHAGRVFGGMHHFSVMNHPDVYDVLRHFIAGGDTLHLDDVPSLLPASESP